MRRPPLTPVRVALAIGAGTVAVGVVLAAAFLTALTGVPGTAPPFTSLSGGDAVSPVAASVWTYADATFVHPTVEFQSETGARVLVRRDVLDVLDGSTDPYAALRVVPPLLFVLGGAVLTAIDRRVRVGSPPPRPVVGVGIVLGAAPALVALVLLSQVPVAPGATGKVEVGSTVFQASELRGVTAGPPLLQIVAVAVVYPLVFGGLGGWLEGVPRLLPAERGTPE